MVKLWTNQGSVLRSHLLAQHLEQLGILDGLRSPPHILQNVLGLLDDLVELIVLDSAKKILNIMLLKNPIPTSS